MKPAVFLSASVPDHIRDPKFAETADMVAIASAVSALVYVLLGRRLLIWGGHPAITPMISQMSEDIGVSYRDWVKLYQSEFFRGRFPRENNDFDNVELTAASANREDSLALMRKKMLGGAEYSAGVFIGGMEGVLAEASLFRERHPAAAVLPVASTGAAAKLLYEQSEVVSPALETNLDYVGLLHDLLDISPRERRYETPEDQPVFVEDRLRHLPS